MKKVVAIGGGQRALPTLKAILADNDVKVVAVIGMPGHPDERIHCSELKELAKKENIQFIESQIITSQIIEKVISLEADAMIGIGVWRSIIPHAFLESTRLGFLAVHGTGLPRYRGWAGINWQIINGEECIHMQAYRLACGVDDGDLVVDKVNNSPFNATINLNNENHLLEIFAEYEKQHIKLVRFILKSLKKETIGFVEQADECATYGCHRGPHDAEINWSDSSQKIFNFIRGQSRPYQGAFTFFGGKRIAIHRAKIRNEYINYSGRICGKVVHRDIKSGSVVILTGDSSLEILETDVYQEGAWIHVNPYHIFNTVRSKCKSRVEAYLDSIGF
jgi:methionyl-tRNA formyltransferase